MTIGQRHTTRAIIFSQDDRVPLIRFVVEVADGTRLFWASPGGKIESGEDPMTAATPKVREKLGLELVLTRPVHETTSQLVHAGNLVDNHDTYLAACCTSGIPDLRSPTADELANLRELRW